MLYFHNATVPLYFLSVTVSVVYYAVVTALCILLCQ